MNGIEDADGQHWAYAKGCEQDVEQKSENVCRSADDSIANELFRPFQNSFPVRPEPLRGDTGPDHACIPPFPRMLRFAFFPAANQDPYLLMNPPE